MFQGYVGKILDLQLKTLPFHLFLVFRLSGVTSFAGEPRKPVCVGKRLVGSNVEPMTPTTTNHD